MDCQNVDAFFQGKLIFTSVPTYGRIFFRRSLLTNDIFPDRISPLWNCHKDFQTEIASLKKRLERTCRGDDVIQFLFIFYDWQLRIEGSADAVGLVKAGGQVGHG